MNSKLTLHVSGYPDPEYLYDWLRDVQPRSIKFFGHGGLNTDQIATIRDICPNTLLTARSYIEQNFNLEDMISRRVTPEQAAQHSIGFISQDLQKFAGLIDVYEGDNEVPVDNDASLTTENWQRASWLAEYNNWLGFGIRSYGYKYAAYSFATGNPVHPELWDVLQGGLSNADYIALHQYHLPDEWWHECYMGMVNATLPIPTTLPILITETGCDYHGMQGYKGQYSIPQYIEHLAQIDSVYLQSDRIVSAAIFCYAIDSAAWASYDISSKEFMNALRETMFYA